MTGNSRKILKSLTEQINKASLLFNASTAIGNATERAQEQIFNFHNLASKKYMNIIRDINSSAVIKNFNATSVKISSSLPKRFFDYWQWYQQLTGLDKLDLAKQQVIVVQDKLFKCQDQRRSLTQQVVTINDKLKEIYSELIQTKRDDSKYVQLTILENKNLQEQSKVTAELELLENEERDYFTQLATTIKEYHDRQTINAQKYKYFSMLASALLAIVSLISSMIYNNKRISEMKSLIFEAQCLTETSLNDKFNVIIERLEKQEKNIASPLTTPSLNRINAISVANMIDQNTVDDLTVSDTEKIKQMVYYIGITMCTLYILQQILKN